MDGESVTQMGREREPVVEHRFDDETGGDFADSDFEFTFTDEEV